MTSSLGKSYTGILRFMTVVKWYAMPSIVVSFTSGLGLIVLILFILLPSIQGIRFTVRSLCALYVKNHGFCLPLNVYPYIFTYSILTVESEQWLTKNSK